MVSDRTNIVIRMKKTSKSSVKIGNTRRQSQSNIAKAQKFERERHIQEIMNVYDLDAILRDFKDLTVSKFFTYYSLFLKKTPEISIEVSLVSEANIIASFNNKKIKDLDTTDWKKWKELDRKNQDKFITKYWNEVFSPNERKRSLATAIYHIEIEGGGREKQVGEFVDIWNTLKIYRKVPERKFWEMTRKEFGQWVDSDPIIKEAEEQKDWEMRDGRFWELMAIAMDEALGKFEYRGDPLKLKAMGFGFANVHRFIIENAIKKGTASKDAILDYVTLTYPPMIDKEVLQKIQESISSLDINPLNLQDFIKYKDESFDIYMKKGEEYKEFGEGTHLGFLHPIKMDDQGMYFYNETTKATYFRKFEEVPKLVKEYAMYKEVFRVTPKRMEIQKHLQQQADEIDQVISKEIGSYKPLGRLSELAQAIHIEPKKGINMNTPFGEMVFAKSRYPSTEIIALWEKQHAQAEELRDEALKYSFSIEPHPHITTGNYKVVEQGEWLQKQGLLTPKEEEAFNKLKQFWEQHPELDKQKDVGMWDENLNLVPWKSSLK